MFIYIYIKGFVNDISISISISISIHITWLSCCSPWAMARPNLGRPHSEEKGRRRPPPRCSMRSFTLAEIISCAEAPKITNEIWLITYYISIRMIYIYIWMICIYIYTYMYIYIYIIHINIYIYMYGLSWYLWIITGFALISNYPYVYGFSSLCEL